LVVDDEDTSRSILFGSLAKEGYTIAQAQSGAAALEMLKIEIFDLVLLDIVMPEMDGIQVLETMKQSDTLKRTPVMMTTASKEAGSVTKCIRLGAVDYIVKPYDVAKIHTRIWRYLTKDKPPKHVEATPALLKPSRVLIVDTAELSRNTVLARLKQTQHTVEAVDSVGAATTLLETTRIDLILIDIASLDLEGYSFIEQLKNNERTSNIPFAIVTGDKNSDTMHRCVKLGAIDYIQKPFEAIKLKHRIDACLLAQQRKKAAAG
ncbi:MAG: response regulator, partial [Gammaproteobacteria bacterium]|nr:response regulator [Gammaproteobacteria bacterium]